MKKSDLKAGMLVEYRCGERRMFMPYGLVKESGLVARYSCKYNDDLIDIDGINDLDIMKVYDVFEDSFDFECENRELLWERKEKPKLTEVEKTILENIPKEYKYIARDEDEELYIYEEKPRKVEEAWQWGGLYVDFGLFNHLFNFIKWEDDEPNKIEELLN